MDVPLVPWDLATDADREAVREQVGRILASTLFRNSRRFPSFLRHTVEHALNGTTDLLKERTLGIEAFGRDVDYDTAQDPVVRITAAEVRKRLVQYYQAPEHEDELRIGFQTGSYVPEFYRAPAPAAATAAAAVNAAGAQGLSGAQERESALPAAAADAAEDAARAAGTASALGASRGRRWLSLPAPALAAIAMVTIAAVALAAWGVSSRVALASPTTLDQFWAPVIDASAPALLCIGDQWRASESPRVGSGQPDTDGPTSEEFLQRNAVRYTDAVTLAQLTGELRSRSKAFRIRRPESTNFADLRDGPVILVGGFNNPWTMKLSDGLRFTLARTDDGVRYIRDRQHPDDRTWNSGNRSAPLSELHETFGLITRVFDPSTGHPIVMTSGLILGTRGAGECLIDATCLDQARRRAPGDWRQRNVQVVVATKVIGEEPGAPRVVAAHLW